jgi:DNA primase
MAAFARLDAESIARIRSEHSVVDVLSRLGVDPPANWDGAADYMIRCPCPEHDDATPSCVIHPQTDRFNCFGCGARGDVLELVMRVESVRSLSAAAGILDSRRPLVPSLRGDDQPAGIRASAQLVDSADKPDLGRTAHGRVMAANEEAWRFLSLPKLAERGREYLRGRHIDVSALEAETGRPLVGHTPFSDTGLVSHLNRRGFSPDEIVDAGWGSRREGVLRDRFRRRVIIPVRDGRDRIIGVYGRDVTGHANQKYLNTAETVAFHKGSTVYRANANRGLHPHATVIACEGSIDSLAISALAAAAGRSALFAPVSPSGTALTADQASAVLAISPKPPLVCADGDCSGLAASGKWVQAFMAQGRETLVTVLPDGHDPASWLRLEGARGLRAFIRKGCLDRPDSDVKPVPAGGLLARQAMEAALATPGADALKELPGVIAGLAKIARLVPGAAPADRFAAAAGHALAEYSVGTDTGLARLVRAATGTPAAPAPVPQRARSSGPAL